MNYCSYFIEDKALFGSFPDQTRVHILEENGVRYFIDLTENNEAKTIPYTTKYKYIKYPISDWNIPDNETTFCVFIAGVCDIIRELKNDEKIYVHCKGGHGRSGVVVACILAYYHGYSPVIALEKTAEYHSLRETMREKWRKIGSPQNLKQQVFVRELFKPCIIGQDISIRNLLKTGLRPLFISEGIVNDQCMALRNQIMIEEFKKIFDC